MQRKVRIDRIIMINLGHAISSILDDGELNYIIMKTETIQTVEIIYVDSVDDGKLRIQCSNGWRNSDKTR